MREIYNYTTIATTGTLKIRALALNRSYLGIYNFWVKMNCFTFAEVVAIESIQVMLFCNLGNFAEYYNDDCSLVQRRSYLSNIDI